MDRLHAAKLVSRLAHKGQVDLQGVPYYKHPEYVASLVKTRKEKVVAYLHDVLEDTDVTEEELRPVFGDELTDAVLLLTHDPSVEYMDYVKKIAPNRIARHVKMADLTHNMDLSRWEDRTPTEWNMKKRAEKYIPAYEYLLEADKNDQRRKK